MFPAMEGGEKNTEEYEQSLPQNLLGILLFTYHFYILIWSDTHMVDRISSLFQGTQLESGRVRGTEGCFDADALSCFPG